MPEVLKAPNSRSIVRLLYGGQDPFTGAELWIRAEKIRKVAVRSAQGCAAKLPSRACRVLE